MTQFKWWISRTENHVRIDVIRGIDDKKRKRDLPLYNVENQKSFGSQKAPLLNKDFFKSHCQHGVCPSALRFIAYQDAEAKEDPYRVCLHLMLMNQLKFLMCRIEQNEAT